MQTGIDRSRGKPRQVFQAYRATEGRCLLFSKRFALTEFIFEFIRGLCYIIEKGNPEKRLALTIAN